MGDQLQPEDDDQEGADVGRDLAVLGQAGQHVGADREEPREDEEAQLGVAAGGADHAGAGVGGGVAAVVVVVVLVVVVVAGSLVVVVDVGDSCSARSDTRST